ncbi:hypothetical protein JZU46_00600 [bacterium]|nr:hypothetical protein [bacterium]
MKADRKGQKEPRPPITRKRNWTQEERKARSDKLKHWLDSKAKGEGAGKLINKPYSQIAKTLMNEFRRTVSSSSARLYVKEAQKTFDVSKLEVLPCGRPKGSKESGKVVKRAPTPKPPQPPGILDAIALELLAATHLSPSALYKHLSKNDLWKGKIGARSSFYLLLSRQCALDTQANPSKLSLSGDTAHVLSVHQVVLKGPRKSLRVLLFAYDLKTHFINAVIFEIQGHWHASPCVIPSPEVAGRRTRNRRKKYHPSQGAVVQTGDGDPTVILPVEAILEFALTTRAKINVPIGGWLLNASLHLTEDHCRQLNMKRPQWTFELQPDGQRQYVHSQLGEKMPLATLCQEVFVRLNSHNHSVAEPMLKAIQLANAKCKRDVLAEIKRSETSLDHWHPRRLKALKEFSNWLSEEDDGVADGHRFGEPKSWPIVRLKGIYQAVGVNLTTTLPPKTD